MPDNPDIELPKKGGGLGNSVSKKVGQIATVINLIEAVADWALEAIKDGKVQVAFALNKDDIAEYASVVDGLIGSSGEKGALIGMYCIKGELLTLPQIYPGPVVVGLGQDPQDAMDKYYLTETKIEEPFPGVKIFAEGQGYKNPAIGDECFGVWVDKGDGPNARKISLVTDIEEMNAASNITWITHKSNLLLKKNKDAIAELANTNKTYNQMLDKFADAAMKKGILGSIANLIQANAKAHEKFLQAANDVNKAIEREKKYRIYSQLGALLGLAGSVLQISDSLAANSGTSADYFKTVYEKTGVWIEENQKTMNAIFIKEFGVKAEALPNPEVPELILP